MYGYHLQTVCLLLLLACNASFPLFAISNPVTTDDVRPIVPGIPASIELANNHKDITALYSFEADLRTSRDWQAMVSDYRVLESAIDNPTKLEDTVYDDFFARLSSLAAAPEYELSNAAVAALSYYFSTRYEQYTKFWATDYKKAIIPSETEETWFRICVITWGLYNTLHSEATITSYDLFHSKIKPELLKLFYDDDESDNAARIAYLFIIDSVLS